MADFSARRKRFATLAAMVTMALVATVGLVAVASPAAAEFTGRPPRSGSMGTATPEWATDVIPTNIVMHPEGFPDSYPYTIVSVQYAAMGKVSRDGVLDQDHAIAFWKFQVRFPRGPVNWPPFIPEPTDPWGFYFFEMPNGDAAGTGVMSGSPVYGPQGPGVGANWPDHMVAAAWANIPDLEEQAEAKVKEKAFAQLGIDAEAAHAMDVGELAQAVLDALEGGSILAGPCGVALVGLISAELLHLVALVALAVGPRSERGVAAAAAAATKIQSSLILSGLLATCTAQAELVRAENPPLALFYDRIKIAGIAFWFFTLHGFSIVGTLAAIRYWITGIMESL